MLVWIGPALHLSRDVAIKGFEGKTPDKKGHFRQ
jgi:hypothetical protein